MSGFYRDPLQDICLFELSELKHCLYPDFNYHRKKNLQKIEKDNLKIPFHNVLIAFGMIKADIGICLVYTEWP